jgi:MFS family permease
MDTAMSCNNIGMIISPMLGGIVYEKSGKLVDLAIMISIGAFGIILRLLTNEPPRTTASVSAIINTVETARKKDEKFRLQVNITII